MSNLKIAPRLALAFSILILFIVVILGIGIGKLNAVSTDTANMMAKPLTKERLVSDWYRTIHTSVRRSTAIAKSADPSLASFFAADNTLGSKTSTEQQNLLATLIETPEEKKFFDDTGVARKAFVSSRDAIGKAKLAGQAADAELIFNRDFQPAATRYLAALHSLLELQRAGINAAARGVEDTYVAGRNQLLMLGVGAILIAVLLAVVITRGITGPLRTAVDAAETVASGDLRHRSGHYGKDETGQLLNALNAMSGQLRETVEKVRRGADGIALASSEIATGNLDLSSRTEEQASALQQTAASMEQMTATVRQNAENARQANQLAQSTSELAVRGGGMVGEVVQTMAGIQTSATRIVDIISVIDGIAFQTNILALNAAVEAARAGEHGRGFAVVAAEVRTLSQRSAAAAREIKTLIDDSVQRVGDGNRLVKDAGAVIDDVVKGVRQVTDIVGEITSASHEQTLGLEQVNQAITQMDQVTQQNAALVEEAAAATGSLEAQTTQLVQSVAVFRTDSQPRHLQLSTA